MDENKVVGYQRGKAQLLIQKERARQIELWGDEPAMIDKRGFGSYLYNKMVVLMEELGEACKEVQSGDLGKLLNETVQTAAVAQAVVEGTIDYISRLEHERVDGGVSE